MVEMKEFIFIGAALMAGIGAFALIMRKQGNDCIP